MQLDRQTLKLILFSSIIYILILYYFPVRNDLSACDHLRFEWLYIHTSNINDLFDMPTFLSFMLHIRKDMITLSTSVCCRLSFMLRIRKDMFTLSTSVCGRLYATDTEGYVYLVYFWGRRYREQYIIKDIIHLPYMWL